MANEGSIGSSIVAGVDGHDLLAATRVATEWLALDRNTINALNVFPVPDGDTGTNMLLTMREAVAASSATASRSASVGSSAATIEASMPASAAASASTEWSPTSAPRSK